MIRDPFYRQIEAALSEPLDGDLFERCACELINNEGWPVAPIPGGDDLGMDGAVADGEGVPFPLVCTVRDDIIGNFTHNLHRYLQTGGTRRKVIVATSRQLTTRKHRNLIRRAEELEFILIDWYDRAKLARLLYHSPLWCRDLLGLTGNPSALSLFPRSIRHSFDIPLIGRDRDMKHLTSIQGDRLLVGQPGSGKTFLLSAIARDHNGAFVVNDDIGAIAASFREQQPSTLIIDDAFQHQDLITALKQYREATGANFSIIASCWPGDRAVIENTLALSSSAILPLAPLIREHMAEIVRSSGIAGPNELIGEILDQAQGMPGLAVTLARLCHQGDWKEVLCGEILLKRHIKGDFQRLLGVDATITLAAFALGGRSGMTLEGVAEGTGHLAIALRREIDGLASGGVVYESGDRLIVRSETLQCVLVREVFFCGARSLPYEDLLEHIPSVDATTVLLILVRLRGGTVPAHLLWNLLQKCQWDKPWKYYCLLGHDQVAVVLDVHPEKLHAIAPYALDIAPNLVIPLILNDAVVDETSKAKNDENRSLRLLKDWVEAAEPGKDEMVSYRRELLNATISWLQKSPEHQIAVHTLSYVISPEYDLTRSDPINRRIIAFHFGVGTPAELRAIEKLWDQCLIILRSLSITNWQPLFQVINSWLYSMSKFGKVVETDEVSQLKQEIGKRMLRDLASISRNHPGVQHRISFYIRVFKVEISLHLDHDYDMLFGDHDPDEDWSAFNDRQYNLISGAAQHWSTDGPIISVARYERLFDAYTEMESHGPRRDHLLFYEIAQHTEHPDEWLDVILLSRARAEMAPAFFTRLNELRPPGWELLFRQGLDDVSLRGQLVYIALSASDMPIDIIHQVLAFSDVVAWILPQLCYRRAPLPEEIMHQFLTHPECSVAVEAAIAEWQSEPEGYVRKPLAEVWRNAMLRGNGDETGFCDILCSDTTLFIDWLLGHLQQNATLPYRLSSQLPCALKHLDQEARMRVIDNLPDDRMCYDLVRHVVDSDPVIYRYLLSKPQLDFLHLQPLIGRPTDIWCAMALEALIAGYEPEQIMFMAFSEGSWRGKKSDYWAEWQQQLLPLTNHADEQLAQIGRIGLAAVSQYRESSLEEERQCDVYGF